MGFLNGGNTPFWTSFMQYLSREAIWLLFYATLVGVILANFRVKYAVIALLIIALVITFTDMFTSQVIRDLVDRPRPNNPLSPVYDTIFSTRSSKGYGFPSCHAANVVALCTIYFLYIRKKALSICLLFWALLISYSRIYLGMHYPADIVVGWIIGIIFGYLGYKLFLLIKERGFKESEHLRPAPKWIFLLPIGALAVTLIYITLRSLAI